MPARTLFASSILLGWAAVLPAFAHHSAAMFDREREVVLTGTVREFQYTSPHSWIQIIVPGENGTEVEWSVEAAAPVVLLRNGIRPNALQPGDRVSVRAHPLRDGAPGALVIDVTKADGIVLAF